MTEPATTFATLLGHLRTAYADEREVRVSGVVGQTTTADWCAGACGQVFLRLDNLYRSSTQFPNPDNTPDSCGGSMTAVWHLGIWRCVHGLTTDGQPPAPEDQTTDTVQLLEDTCTLRRAVEAYADGLRASKGAYLLGRWTPMGPFGNCAGGYWTLTTRLGRTRPSS